ncbi:hypothetical protein Tco_0716759 [Tanacetum coccineum]
MNTFIILTTPFQKFFQSTVVNSYNSEYDASEAREDFKQYTQMEAQTFGDLIIQNMDSIEKCISERILHDLKTETENENIVSGNENSISENRNNKSRSSTNISGNDTKVNRADIRPTYDKDSLEQVDNSEYKVFAMEKEHPEQPEFVNDTYLVEQGDTNTTFDSSDMSNNRREADQDDDLAKERDLLASLVEQLKCEINDNKKQNQCLESLNKAFKEANIELGEANTSLTNENDKYQIELARYQNIKYVKDAEFECAKAYGLLAEQKVTSEIF